jgi:hypothetical protein
MSGSRKNRKSREAAKPRDPTWKARRLLGHKIVKDKTKYTRKGKGRESGLYHVWSALRRIKFLKFYSIKKNCFIFATLWYICFRLHISDNPRDPRSVEAHSDPLGGQSIKPLF